jgi:glutamine synthetase
MYENLVKLNPNKLVQYLDKPAEDFTKRDLMKFIEGNGIQMVNFRYVGGDGRLKRLNFVIEDKAQLDLLLSIGERVDGSSLFSFVDASSSDLYVIPRFKTAFVNPFSEIPAIDILCSYYDVDGSPLASSPENTLRKAHQVLKEKTGLSMEAMGELEYYIFYSVDSPYPTESQRGYHESSPFSKWEKLRCEAMEAIAASGGRIKYGHSEVGAIKGEDEGVDMEQHEIEFSPVRIEDAADQLVVAKWILRMIGYKHQVPISFAPKVVVGHAGSGLHIHSRLLKDGRNMLVDGGQLSDIARQNIAGYLKLSPSLTAFGNTVPLSYLRLVPHQEAPTNICWGDRNRSTLVRVPLGWLGVGDMIRDANPQEPETPPPGGQKQTIEFRSPDGSANVYLLLAGLTVAARAGMEMDDALQYIDDLYVKVNVFDNQEVEEKLPHLPTSCWESADKLQRDRGIYEMNGVFSPSVIDDTIGMLKSYDDQDLSERLYGNSEEIQKLVNEYLHHM